jgi:hypothetical protein
MIKVLSDWLTFASFAILFRIAFLITKVMPLFWYSLDSKKSLDREFRLIKDS